MKILIDIPEEVKSRIAFGITYKDDIQILADAIDNGTPLPDNATNGDIIKTLFPNGSQVKGAEIYIMNDNKSNVFYDFNWWNAPYKRGDTE